MKILTAAIRTLNAPCQSSAARTASSEMPLARTASSEMRRRPPGRKNAGCAEDPTPAPGGAEPTCAGTPADDTAEERSSASFVDEASSSSADTAARRAAAARGEGARGSSNRRPSDGEEAQAVGPGATGMNTATVWRFRR
ncbi:unnamed protein product [Ectocarpus sp. 4 AP-2014]